MFIHIVKIAEAGSQFIIVTLPILLGISNTDIISFDDGEIHRCKYEEMESYQVTKMFLMHREKRLERMLEGMLGEQRSDFMSCIGKIINKCINIVNYVDETYYIVKCP